MRKLPKFGTLFFIGIIIVGLALTTHFSIGVEHKPLDEERAFFAGSSTILVGEGERNYRIYSFQECEGIDAEIFATPTLFLANQFVYGCDENKNLNNEFEYVGYMDIDFDKTGEVYFHSESGYQFVLIDVTEYEMRANILLTLKIVIAVGVIMILAGGKAEFLGMKADSDDGHENQIMPSSQNQPDDLNYTQQFDPTNVLD